jgi:hypothetical protein
MASLPAPQVMWSFVFSLQNAYHTRLLGFHVVELSFEDEEEFSMQDLSLSLSKFVSKKMELTKTINFFLGITRLNSFMDSVISPRSNFSIFFLSLS